MLDELLKENNIIVACFVLTTLYVGFSKEIIKGKVLKIFKNEYFRLAMLMLIIYVGQKNILLSLCLTIVFLVSLLQSNNIEGFENHVDQSDADDNVDDDDEKDDKDEKDDAKDNVDDNEDSMNTNDNEKNDMDQDNNNVLKCPPGCVPANKDDDNLKDLNSSDDLLADDDKSKDDNMDLKEDFNVFNKEHYHGYTVNKYKHGF